MALTREEEQQILKLLLKTQEQSFGVKSRKPLPIRALQFSMVLLSFFLFIAVSSLGILLFTRPTAAFAANTYAETWTATNGIYTKNSGGAADTGGTIQYFQGLPANATTAGGGGLIFNNGVGMTVPGGVTVTQWSVSGAIN